ncbi:ATP-binding protein [Methanomethylophilus alvi]|uniref:ATP-binding protein n=1 Tax=Methanomethylophilus alvi TaxID=1291540 RepID=UPI0037DCF5E6
MSHPVVVRKAYLNRLYQLSTNRDVVKVISGNRYCGKSTLMSQFRDMLLNKGVPEPNIIYLDMSESMGTIDDSFQFTGLVKSRLSSEDAFLLVDDMNFVNNWDSAIKDLRERYRLNIYIVLPYATSEDYRGILDALGNYDVTTLYTFSFKEFLEAYPITDEHGYGERFEQYISIGGQPFMDMSMSQKDHFMISEGMFNLILNWDIGSRSRIDTVAISRLALYILNNIGNVTTLSALRQNSNVTDQRTVEKYLHYLLEYQTIMKAEAVDITDMRRLGVKAKYYTTDVRSIKGITPRGAFSVSRQATIENIVFLELVRRGYEVYAGFYRGNDIGFMAIRGGETIFVKSVLALSDERAKGKEFKAFASVPGKKYLLTTDRGMNGFYDNIEYKNIISFLLE